MKRGLVAVLVSALLAPCFCLSKTWRIPSEHPTIFGAVDSASYGDTVLVAPGTYLRERAIEVKFGMVWIVMKDGITLISEGGPEVTELVEICPCVLNIIIRCDSISDAEIRGFTIRVEDCGQFKAAYEVNTGIYLEACKMTVEDNIIHGPLHGISVCREPPRPDRPIIRGNEIHDCGVGIDLWEVWSVNSPRILDNHIHLCWEHGIRSWNSDPYVSGNLIEYNLLNGVLFEGYSMSLLVSNKILHNGGNGVVAIMDYAYNHPCLNSTGYNEKANDVYGNGSYDVYYSEGTGLGLFGAARNYWGTLCPDSSRFYGRVDWVPWVDSTHTVSCSDCDTCHHATEPATWGSIKAMYR